MSDSVIAEVESKRKNLKATWAEAIWSFVWPLALVLCVRWALIEPFVIPSGSMIPNLLVHDHIFVSKYSYGLHVPFGRDWMLRWSEPKRGEVIVFRYPENPEIFYIKRLIGLPGDRIKIKNGSVAVNSNVYPLKEISFADSESGFKYFEESNGAINYVVRFLDYQSSSGIDQEVEVQPGHYFFMGDNRDQSSDSRFWGQVPVQNIIGKAQMIWLSCEKTLESAPYLCDPNQLRFSRFFQRVR